MMMMMMIAASDHMSLRSPGLVPQHEMLLPIAQGKKYRYPPFIHRLLEPWKRQKEAREARIVILDKVVSLFEKSGAHRSMRSRSE